MTSRMQFIVIGAMKAATSTVCAYLEDHPDIYMVPECEPNYFNRDENYARGEAWYHAHLTPRTHERLCGEGTNNYAARDTFPESAARMAAYNPDMKIIYIVRHPVDRIVSAWIQNRVNQRDMVPPTLDRAVQEMPERFVGQSLYWHNISAYRALFGDEQIFVGFMDDLQQDADAFFARLTAFLGVPPAPHIQRGHLNKSMGKRVPTRAYTALNNLPFAGTLKQILPREMRHFARRRVLSRTMTEKPDFSPQVRADLIARLRPDTTAFLSHYGKPADFWQLEDAPSQTG